MNESDLRNLGFQEISPGVWSRASCSGIETLRPSQPEHAERDALVKPLPREEKSGLRFEIMFHIYAVRPCDWDNYSIKELQDMVIKSGIIPDDHWTVIERGSIHTHKAGKKSEERTEIVITRL